MSRGLQESRLRWCGPLVLASALVVWAPGLGCKVDERDVQITAPDGGDVDAMGSLESPAGAGGSGGSDLGGEGGLDPDLPLDQDLQTEVTPGSLGDACSQDTSCEAGHCVGEICCDSPCTGPCAACNLPGSLGVCSPAPAGTACQQGGACDDQGSCLVPDQKAPGEVCEVDDDCAEAQTCSTPGQCSTNLCVPAADGNDLSRCCRSCAQGQLCTPEGACVNPQSELGGDCSSDAECRVGVCASGLCCLSACDPACETCGGDGLCQSNGACDAFDCIAPDPPPVTANLPVDNIFLLSGLTPPAARGGTVRDGRYTPTRIDIYGESSSGVFVPTYEFRGRSVQIAEQDFFQFSPPGSFIPERRYAGSFTTAGSSMQFALERCDPQFDLELRTQPVQYTASANGLVVISEQTAGTVVISYVFQ